MTCSRSLVHPGMEHYPLSHSPVCFILYHISLSTSSCIILVLKDNPVLSLVDQCKYYFVKNVYKACCRQISMTMRLRYGYCITLSLSSSGQVSFQECLPFRNSENTYFLCVCLLVNMIKHVRAKHAGLRKLTYPK